MATDQEIRDQGFFYIPDQQYLQSPFVIPTTDDGSGGGGGGDGGGGGIVNTDAFNNNTNIFAGYDDKIGAPGAYPFLNMSQADFNKQLFETGPYADPYAQTDYNKFPMADPLNQKIVDKLREDRNLDATYTNEELINMYGNQNFKGGMFEDEEEEFNFMDYLPFVGSKSAFQGIMGALPKQDSRFTDIRSYYGGRDNLDNIGRIQSGLMAGYNPVSGGLLNMITGGKYGSPTTYGLQKAYQKRIDMINKTLNRKRKDPKYDDTVLTNRLAKLKEEKAAEQKALQTAQAKKDYNTIQDAYDKQTGAGSSYSGGDDNREARSTGNYHDPFNPGYAD